MVASMAESFEPGGSAEPSDENERRARMTADMPPCHCVICHSDATRPAGLDPTLGDAFRGVYGAFGDDEDEAGHDGYDEPSARFDEEPGLSDEGEEEADEDAESLVDKLVPGWFGEAAAHVRKTGWTSIGIMPGTRTPGWAFSVGLWHSYRAPEVSIFGLLLPDMQQRVNRAGRLIRDNKPFGVDIEVDGILDAQPVVAKPVHPAWYPALFGFAVGFYRGAVPPFVQLVWPDSHGVFPWQPGCGLRCRTVQPQLWLPPDVHPQSAWQNPQ
jgi:hypothetical protein